MIDNGICSSVDIHIRRSAYYEHHNKPEKDPGRKKHEFLLDGLIDKSDEVYEFF